MGYASKLNVRNWPTFAFAGGTLLLMTALGLATVAYANEPVEKPAGVVELFTSQGCASCPPADALLEKLADEGAVVALAFHVNYWDYLGWRDTLGSEQNTERQNAYRLALGTNGIYTPQMIINGREHVIGSEAAKVRGRIAAMQGTPKGLTVPVNMESRDPDRLIIKLGAGEKKDNPVHVLVVYFEGEKTITIDKGENTGKTVTYANVVRAVETVGMWDGKEQQIDIPLSALAIKKAAGCAVLLQEMLGEGRPGPIIGASIMPAEKYARKDRQKKAP